MRSIVIVWYTYIVFPLALLVLPHVRPMPTPRDSTDALPLERELSAHATCPPEEDRSGQWRVDVLDRLGRATLDTNLRGGATLESEGPSSEVGTPGLLDAPPDRASNKLCDYKTLTDASDSSPLLTSATPPNAHTYDKEGPLTCAPATDSSALDLHISIRHGIESSRVCCLEPSESQMMTLSLALAGPNTYLLHAPSR